jgi:two-component system chemotaxis response regulator CheY
MRLLIVDDSRIIRNRIRRAVEDYNLQVVGTAVDGQEAVDMAIVSRPQIITMDLTMPNMDGIEAIEKVLEIDPNVLILVVSALADKATAIQAMVKGAHGFLCKPFSEREITEALGKLIEGAAK